MRPNPRLVAILLLLAARPAAACELDGLSHGYGPMSALFAGAHRYQSLNGLEAEAETAETEAPAPTADPAREDASVKASSASSAVPLAPPPPRRSFVAWAKARPKPAGATEAPATWARSTPPPAAPSVDAPASPPERKPRP